MSSVPNRISLPNFENIYNINIEAIEDNSTCGVHNTTLATILGEQYNGQTAQAALHFQENLAEDVNQVNYPEPFGNVYLDYEKNIVKKANDYQANHRRNMSSSVNGMFRAVQVIILPCTCSVDKLSLNVNVKFDDGLSLLGCLERYFQTWTTNESCIRCAKSQLPARAYLWNLPPILIIHLGRWNSNGEKNERFVDFPMENLDISSYLHPDAPDNGMGKGNMNYSLY
uniref:ubiquitinyl hydrolase 1 n=1 Tax=Meloidogyne incognita TaxID=6306 RepID=A0A914LSC9_MELIC